MNTLASCQKVKAQVEKLCDSVKSLSVGAESTDVYVFGSRLYELATETSKIDLYVNTSKTAKNYVSVFILKYPTSVKRKNVRVDRFEKNQSEESSSPVSSLNRDLGRGILLGRRGVLFFKLFAHKSIYSVFVCSQMVPFTVKLPAITTCKSVL